MNPELVAEVERWIADDPDTADRDELRGLIVAGDEAELRLRFGGRLQFGTAGLRGRVGAGPMRMNRATVRRATAGLVAYLDRVGVAGAVVVGRDARHGSAAFFDEVVAVVGGTGRQVVVLPVPGPTPLVPFAVLELRAAAGVMITASHNPAADNGYKVYLDDGRQIAPPTDTLIAAAIDAVGHLSSLPLDSPRSSAAPVDLVDRYLAAAIRCCPVPSERSTRVAYTPMHGVGGELAVAAFARAGFPPVAVVDEQFEPDPDFPTVVFPNPEEPGAMDAVVELAGSVGADVALAHDPDADRLGVAVPSPDGWSMLRGDDIGVLLADHLLTHSSPTGPRHVVTTVVSSRLLFALAATSDATAVETLTGFKWVSRGAPPSEFLFGYEEALGYLVGGAVRDKDGISAALVLAEAISVLAARGQTLLGRLDELYADHGVHLTDQVVIRDDTPGGLDRLAAALDTIRTDPPRSFGADAVVSVEDLLDGERLPSTDALLFDVEGGRIVFRPSGTEPKLKCYLEAIEHVANGDVAAARAVARTRLDRWKQSLPIT